MKDEDEEGEDAKLPKKVAMGASHVCFKQGYAFEGYCWARAGFRVHNLRKVFRQSDKHFIRALNDLRHGLKTPQVRSQVARMMDEGCFRRNLAKRPHLQPIVLDGANK